MKKFGYIVMGISFVWAIFAVICAIVYASEKYPDGTFAVVLVACLSLLGAAIGAHWYHSNHELGKSDER
jgi:hypothetical protein